MATKRPQDPQLLPTDPQRLPVASTLLRVSLPAPTSGAQASRVPCRGGAHTNISKSLCHTPGTNNHIINQLGFNFKKGKKSMKVNTELPYDPAIPLLGMGPE